jgi:hypothetical protein
LVPPAPPLPPLPPGTVEDRPSAPPLPEVIRVLAPYIDGPAAQFFFRQLDSIPFGALIVSQALRLVVVCLETPSARKSLSHAIDAMANTPPRSA